jgi:hypothetical protein
LEGRAKVRDTSRPVGASYTPRDLAGQAALPSLEAAVYSPGPLHTRDRESWVLRSRKEISALKVADIAMGGGTFLLAAGRYLADRLLEAWRAEGTTGELVDARHTMVERCLYGVDAAAWAWACG